MKLLTRAIAAALVVLAASAAESYEGTPHAGWIEKGSATAATATATKAAASGKRHYLTHVSASCGAAAIAVLQIKDGVTVLAEISVHNAEVLTFPTAVQITRGAAVSAELATCGAGVVGRVNISGFTGP